jgi:hypothetical protein
MTTLPDVRVEGCRVVLEATAGVELLICLVVAAPLEPLFSLVSLDKQDPMTTAVNT